MGSLVLDNIMGHMNLYWEVLESNNLLLNAYSKGLVLKTVIHNLDTVGPVDNRPSNH